MGRRAIRQLRPGALAAFRKRRRSPRVPGHSTPAVRRATVGAKSSSGSAPSEVESEVESMATTAIDRQPGSAAETGSRAVMLVSGDSHMSPTAEQMRPYCERRHLARFDEFFAAEAAAFSQPVRDDEFRA